MLGAAEASNDIALIIAAVCTGIAAIIAAVFAGVATVRQKGNAKKLDQVQTSVGQVNGHGTIQQATAKLLDNQIDLQQHSIETNDRITAHAEANRVEFARLTALLASLQAALTASTALDARERAALLAEIQKVAADLKSHVDWEMSANGKYAFRPPADETT